MEKKAKVTSVSTNYEMKRAKSESGFTLIEIMVVIGLMGLIMTLFLPGIGMALKVNINNSSRELATVIRAAHDEAILKGQVYRVAFDIDRGEYWVEVGERDFLMKTAEQTEEETKRNQRRNDEEKAKHKEPFQLAAAVTKKKKALPLGVKFTEILTARTKTAATSGVVYSHIFPFGFMEKTVIHLKDGMDRENTLAVSPVTGKSRLFEHYAKEVD